MRNSRFIARARPMQPARVAWLGRSIIDLLFRQLGKALIDDATLPESRSLLSPEAKQE